jgi:hypothetical protein
MAKVCRVEGCTGEVVACGLCSRCYQRDLAVRKARSKNWSLRPRRRAAAPKPPKARKRANIDQAAFNAYIETTERVSVPDRPKWTYEGDESALIEAQKGIENVGN